MRNSSLLLYRRINRIMVKSQKLIRQNLSLILRRYLLIFWDQYDVYWVDLDPVDLLDFTWPPPPSDFSKTGVKRRDILMSWSLL